MRLFSLKGKIGREVDSIQVAGKINEKKPFDRGKLERRLVPIVGCVIGLCLIGVLWGGIDTIDSSFSYISSKGRIQYYTPHLDVNVKELLLGIVMIILASTLIFYLAKTKLGIHDEIDDKINDIDYQIERRRLLTENNELKKKLEKLC